ncbi:MAG: acyloxyacyl hydrolase [Phycisphaerales bacterium]|nr:acyloxyacyl hydrolase [Phycisphaerales bacterium]
MTGLSVLLIVSGMMFGQVEQATPHTGLKIPPPSDGQHLAESLSKFRVAPAAFQDNSPAAEVMKFTLGQAADTSSGATVTAGESEVAEFGTAGSTRWTIHGGWGLDVHGSNQEIQAGVGLQYFLIDGFAFAPELNLWGFFQTGENSFGASLDLMFQWHFLRRDSWSVYGDFGIGLLGTTENVPYDGSQFNFTPQAGFGVTWDIGNNNRWYAGVRWHHISNASLYQNNPGRDSILVYTGINFPF